MRTHSSGARLAGMRRGCAAPSAPQPCTQLTRRRQLQVANCLDCAALQLQQLIRLPTTTSSSSSSEQGRLGGTPLPQQRQCQQQLRQQQQQQQQQQQLKQQFKQQNLGSAAAWPPLALAGAGSHTPASTLHSSGNNLSAATSFLSSQSSRTSSSSGSSSSSSSSSNPEGSSQTGTSAAAAGAGSTDPACSRPGDAPQVAYPGQQPGAHPQPQPQPAEGFPDILRPQSLREEDPPSQQQQQQDQQQGETGLDTPGVRAALAALKWYKGFLSPSMASTCRFLPTCSQYSMDSYRKFGVAKGTVLTAWRLLRCNPWGGSGCDPTSWPPVGLAPLFSLPYSAEVAVVVGTAAFLRFSHALLFE